MSEFASQLRIETWFVQYLLSDPALTRQSFVSICFTAPMLQRHTVAVSPGWSHLEVMVLHNKEHNREFKLKTVEGGQQSYKRFDKNMWDRAIYSKNVQPPTIGWDHRMKYAPFLKPCRHLGIIRR